MLYEQQEGDMEGQWPRDRQNRDWEAGVYRGFLSLKELVHVVHCVGLTVGAVYNMDYIFFVDRRPPERSILVPGI